MPSRADTRVPLLCTWGMWGLFVLVLLGVGVWGSGEWTAGSLLRVDGLTQVMALVTTFVSGIVHSFSRRYMAGAHRLRGFYGRLFGLTLIVLGLTAANHLALFVGLWAAMGWVLADLIGHVRHWPQAQAAAQRARYAFLGGSVLLAGAAALLAWQTGTSTISGALGAVEGRPGPIAGVAGGLLVLTAMVQSALVPFQGWLLSSMTAPTPVSAFMHAGLVNAGGVLIARFAPVLFAEPAVMLVLVAAGGISALLGQAWMLVQTNVKRQLGCSTVAQMGFMVLQGGLGFVAAAVTHLILHGFYKAYLFLAAGSVVEPTRPSKRTTPRPGLLSGLVSLGAAAAGGLLFATLTGKSILPLNSGTLLVLFVVLAVLHATRAVVRRSALSATPRLWAVPALLLPTIGLYATVYNGVKGLLGPLPAATAPTELTALHWTIAGIFLLAYVALERGWHRASIRLYVTLLNTSQPLPRTVLTQRDQYHAH